MYTVCYVIYAYNPITLKYRVFSAIDARRRHGHKLTKFPLQMRRDFYLELHPNLSKSENEKKNNKKIMKIIQFVTSPMKENNEFHLCSSNILANVSCPMEHCYKSTKKTKVCRNLLGILGFQGKIPFIYLSTTKSLQVTPILSSYKKTYR